ncbi:MAG TPA: hypothetical protein VK188_13055 [Holophaga sp.]|nr:hypothetical protein [Holophaga sp.]
MAHDHPDHNHSCGCGHDAHHEDHQDEIEVVELEDENGEKEEFAILEEVDFEDRHFAIMAPLAEVQAYSEAGDETEGEGNLTIEIFEVKGDDFTILEDEAFAQRLLAHLDELSAKLEEEEGK